MAKSGPPIGPLPPNATPFQEKLRDRIVHGESVAVLARKLEMSEAGVRQWVRNEDRSPRLVAVRSLADVTQTPVCYWADDRWPVATAETPPRHMIEFVEEHLRVHGGAPREYGAGDVDHGKIGDGRGAGFAAEADITAARDSPGAAARVLAALAVKVAQAELSQGRTWEQAERAIAQVFEPVLTEIRRARTA